MYAFQIFEVLYSHDDNIDTENLFWLLPICMVIIPFVYFIRIKLYDKHVHGIDLEAMDAELQTYKEKERLQQEGNDAGPNIDQTTDMEQDTNVEQAPENDLSEKIANHTLSQLIKQFRRSVKDVLDLKL